MEQIGIIYPEGCGFPEGSICLPCAEVWEDEHQGEYDTDSGRETAAIFEDESFVCALCGERFSAQTLVAPGDIAARTGYPADTIRRWAQRHPEFRALAAETSAGLIWRWGDVEAWLRRTGRLKEN